jgi:endonuclease III
LLGCILDYQMPAEIAWENARRVAEDIFGNPNDLWHQISGVPLSKWNMKWEEYKLHRYPKAHERVWRIGRYIVAHYGGDARNIWKGQPPDVVLDRLNQMKVGEQISRMIVGALCDTDQIQGSGDVKVDTHLRRVLGRVLRGSPFTPSEAPIVLEKTRVMWPENPWLLDEPLYSLGKEFCYASNPDCGYCYLQKECTFNRMT